MSDAPAEPTVANPALQAPKMQSQTRRVPPYHLILANDDHHSQEFVVDVLRKILEECRSEKAVAADDGGPHRGSGDHLDGAARSGWSSKAEQVHTCHEIRGADKADLGPLSCTIEPAPGA